MSLRILPFFFSFQIASLEKDLVDLKSPSISDVAQLLDSYQEQVCGTDRRDFLKRSVQTFTAAVLAVTLRSGGLV